MFPGKHGKDMTMSAEQLAAEYKAALAAVLDRLDADPDIAQVLAMRAQIERMDSALASRIPNVKPLADLVDTLRAGVSA